MSAHSFGEYVKGQIEEADDLEGLVGAGANVVLRSVPMGLKWILCDKLGVVSEPGLVGLAFWYLLAVAVAYWGCRSTERSHFRQLAEEHLRAIFAGAAPSNPAVPPTNPHS